MRKVSSVRVLADYRLDLTFDNGESGIVDLSHFVGSGIFARWKNEDAFRRVEVGSGGELKWDDEIDFCPDALYLQATGKSPEEVFPNLHHEGVNA